MTRDIVHQDLPLGLREASYPLVQNPVRRHNPCLSGDDGRIQQ
ncbi:MULTISPECIES: hypothetical protein [unclassified Arthrobacter]|nr:MULTISPECIES: hypothetical protein [unclassified Arthrobacter]MDQ0828068.1 hypothetical protein [Arthrobacter sp. B2I5]